MKPPAGRRFAVYAGGALGPASKELSRLLAAGLRAAGARARESDGRKGFARGADWHLVVAPHEFFARGPGARLRAAPWPAGVILYDTAQPGSPAHAFLRGLLPRAHAVWDLDSATARGLAREGWRASFVPPGYVEGCPLFAAKPAPFEARPIDALFVGARTPRRDRLLRALKPALSGLRVRVVAAPRRGRSALDLARRAKLVLNLHRRETRYFEWHRIAVHGLAQGAFVLSEPVSPAPPLKAGRDFRVASPGRLAAGLTHCLKTPRGRREAAATAARGFKTYRRGCRLPAILAKALKGLPRPEGPKARKARGRAAAALALLGV